MRGKRPTGQWIALDGDRLITSGSSAKEVYSKAKAEGVEIPFVELVTNESLGRLQEDGFSDRNPHVRKDLTITAH